MEAAVAARQRELGSTPSMQTRVQGPSGEVLWFRELEEVLWGEGQGLEDHGEDYTVRGAVRGRESLQ